MHDSKIKSRTLPILALLAAVGAVFLLLGRDSFAGERIAQPDLYGLEIRQMTGVDQHTMDLQAEDVLQVCFACTSGSLRLEIIAPSGAAVYSGDGRQVTQFTVTAPEAGAYTLAVTARHARGSLRIQRQQ